MIGRRHIRSKVVEAVYRFSVNERVSYSLSVDKIVSDIEFHDLYFNQPAEEKVSVDEILDLFNRLSKGEREVKYEGRYFTQILNDAFSAYSNAISSYLISLKNGLTLEIEHVYKLYVLLVLVLIDKRNHKLIAKNSFLKLLDSSRASLDMLDVRFDFAELLMSTVYDVVLANDKIITEYASLVDNTNKDDINVLKYIVRELVLNQDSVVDILDQHLFNIKKYRAVVFDIFMHTLKRIKSIDNEVSNLFSKSYVEAMYDVEFYGRLVEVFLANRLRHDELINSRAKNYDIEKVGLLDKVIISLALCEIFYFDDIPTNVAINEYVAISKRYCSVHSTRFINGMIDSIASSDMAYR